MADFEDAVKKLDLPICPHCSEMRQIEQVSVTRWLCSVCAKTFPAVPHAGLFKVLPR